MYDGVDEDLNAALVLERVLAEPTNVTSLEAFAHLKTFLQACLSLHNNADNKPYVGGIEFMKTASGAARHWATAKFARYFPTLGGNALRAAAPAPAPQAVPGTNIPSG